ncbi:5-hydroxytryptamine receptor 2A-like isoform X2 [Cyprinodon tularosa]|uniref:5-hydroxytryptamine receptor 2A-like isoform X2 n=1 Tax=Cyprinodon tularosa TaxID=77115 RepID=UPI0018E24075|nr:5-hydroxytryptamine receptor 2A-like isoform X2 [Cyprinodon tularosa]
MSEVISYTIRTSSTLESNPWPSPLPDNTSHYRCKVSALARNGMETQTLNWSQHNGAGDSGSHCVHSESMVEKNWPALLILVAIGVTVMGNILVILAVSLEKKLQNATNYFLMSLAVADMLLGILVMPVSMVTILYGISMPIPVLGLRDHSKVFKNGNCLLTDDNFVLVGSFIAFFVPLIIMIVTYFLTISALQNEATLCLDRLVPRPKWSTTFTLSFFPQSSVSSDKLFRRSISQEVGRRVSSSGLNGARCSFSGGMFGRRTMQSISNEQKASKVLGVVFFLFVVMWCPFFITNVLMVVCHHHICHPEVMEGLLNIFVWVGYLSSAVNPLVYTLFNKTYRTAFMRYIRCQYQPEKKPLQLILVNTIPPLAFNSSQLALGDMRKLQNGTMHCEKEGRGICLPGRETEQDKQSKCERDKDESSV